MTVYPCAVFICFSRICAFLPYVHLTCECVYIYITYISVVYFF